MHELGRPMRPQIPTFRCPPWRDRQLQATGGGGGAEWGACPAPPTRCAAQFPQQGVLQLKQQPLVCAHVADEVGAGCLQVGALVGHHHAQQLLRQAILFGGTRADRVKGF
jgi:hypothetical protein